MCCLGPRRKVGSPVKIRLRVFVAVIGFVFLGMYSKVLAQDQGDGPTALIITYHARPGARASFRKTMQSEGVAQLESWKKEGVFATYNALFTTYAADSVPDM